MLDQVSLGAVNMTVEETDELKVEKDQSMLRFPSSITACRYLHKENSFLTFDVN